MRPALIPYAGYDRREQLLPPEGVHLERAALELFRTGLDTSQIGARLDVTPASVANALARIRDRVWERRQ